MTSPVDRVIHLLATRGHAEYAGEPVSQLEHALQAAALAAQEGAPPHLIAAALLHDIGHLLHEEGEDAADRGIDTCHEALGEAWLSRHFRSEVVRPAALHVEAKRYLCAVDRDYFAGLSPASVQSLGLQGGPMAADEVDAFEKLAAFPDAVRLRHWDDEAKVPGLAVHGAESYRDLLIACLA